jgi:hypothetical protein
MHDACQLPAMALARPAPLRDDERHGILDGRRGAAAVSTRKTAAPPREIRMFGFGRTVKEPLVDVRSAERWLAAFPGNDPLAVHGELLAELGRIGERTTRRSPACLEAVFYVDAQMAPLRKTLATQYIDHANRSTKIENQLWQSQFDLTQAFLLCYQAFAREVSDHAQSNKWQALLPELIARQVMHLGLDAKIRLYRYEQWIPAKWAELHALFSLACSSQIERHPLVFSAGGDTTTIEHEYLMALVLQLVNSGNLTAKHLEWVAAQLDDWCAPLRLTLEPSTVNSFYVDLGSRTGLRRRSPAPLEGRVLFLDTRPLHALLMQSYVVLEQKLRTQPLSDKTARRSEQLALVTKLAGQVDPEFKPFARRGERTNAVGTVDAIVGFAKIAGFLREEERAPVADAEPGKSYGGTLDLAVFGRMRNESDRRTELSRRRLATYAAPGGPWDVKDVSQTGFRLIAPMSIASAVTLGTLAAIRAHGHTTWTLGVVRRMRRLTTDRAEIGLQVIANTLTGVDLVEQRRTEASDYSIDGEATTVNGRSFPGLYLALRKRESDAVVQSLIVPAVEYQPARRFKVLAARSVTPIRFGRLLEQQPEWVWTAIEPLELAAPPVAPRS